MKKVFVIPMFLLLLNAGCTQNDQQNPGTEPGNTSGELENEGQEEQMVSFENLEVIVENLDIPWSIEKLEDTFYLTERPGYIIRMENGEIERQSVELEKNISTAPEAGLLGVVLAPDFAESNLAYAHYTYVDDSGQFNRIVTLRLLDNIWSEERLLLDHIPSGTYHHGGRLKIGPDGTLYATTGNASAPDIAQDLDSLGGKILRMNLDGSIPSDNPYPNSYVYSYGHRNPQGITWSSDGILFSSEHGSSANDEVNLIEAGQNYGWPIMEGYEEQEGMVSPLFTSGDADTWAPSGMDYYNGKLYVAALRGSAVLEFDLETGEQREVITGLGRIRDVLIEDNSLYFISNNTDGRGTPEENDDKLYRVSLSELN
ncbi:sorbosone dehydrogenase family protein [Halalkalibacter kiskunsagensis]|uniref:Sorbosone dehydrogenase family protein n=1 Tax=Halalkalibacter kiskunsagensis TaxID=1548599 RepID=A0ABV6KF06_9BACI